MSELYFGKYKENDIKEISEKLELRLKSLDTVDLALLDDACRIEMVRRGLA